jgi:hypothetical protein
MGVRTTANSFPQAPVTFSRIATSTAVFAHIAAGPRAQFDQRIFGHLY